MILKQLTLENFRQYLGRQEIIFASGKSKNVTLIYGENGFGKTCFLNALLWGFYGFKGLTKDLPKPEHILPDSIRAQSEHPTQEEAIVEILFKHGDEDYTLTRTTTLAKELETHGEHSRISLAIKDFTGQTYIHEGRDAEKMLEAILPIDLRELIFFNGERIDHLAMEQNAAQVRDAVRGMLGLKLLEQAIDDLKSQNVRGRLMAELKSKADAKTQDLIEQEAASSHKLAASRDALATTKGNLESVANQMSDVSRKLEANKEAHELQKRREILEGELEEKEQSLKSTNAQLSDVLANDGYTLFCQELIQRGESITHRLRAEGRIPARVMNDFIHDLLKANQCICGTCLPEGSEAWKRVEEQLTKAGDPEFNRAVGELDNAIGVIKGTMDRTRESLRRLVGERDDHISRIGAIKEELADIREQLGSKDDQQVHQLEEERNKLSLRKEHLLVEQGRCLKVIEDEEMHLQELKKEIQAQQQKQEEAQKAQRRVQRLEEVISLLMELLDLESKELREELDKEIQRIFRKISVHDYRLELTPDFSLRLTKSMVDRHGNRVDVAHSTGQRQVMSLVFIASLVALAQRRNEIPTIIKNLHGGDFPLVMDSPFGQLGDEFRSAIARQVPALAPQSIILVSSSQYKGEVEQELGDHDRVGKRYYLRYHAKAKRDDAAETISLGGKRFTIFKKSDVEHTEIRDVDS